MKRLLALCFLAASFAFAADLTGRWTGTINVQDKSSGSETATPVEFQLEQHGDVITGKVGRKDDKDAATIKSGRIVGDQITLEVVSNEIVGPARFMLRLIGDSSLQGDMTVRVEEGSFAGKVALNREK